MRHRLVLYFDRKNCAAPDELADETMNRVARRLEEEGTIQTEAPAKYCYSTARFVFWSISASEQRNSDITAKAARRRLLNGIIQIVRKWSSAG